MGCSQATLVAMKIGRCSLKQQHLYKRPVGLYVVVFFLGGPRNILWSSFQGSILFVQIYSRAQGARNEIKYLFFARACAVWLLYMSVHSFVPKVPGITNLPQQHNENCSPQHQPPTPTPTYMCTQLHVPSVFLYITQKSFNMYPPLSLSHPPPCFAVCPTLSCPPNTAQDCLQLPHALRPLLFGRRFLPQYVISSTTLVIQNIFLKINQAVSDLMQHIV